MRRGECAPPEPVREAALELNRLRSVRTDRVRYTTGTNSVVSFAIRQEDTAVTIAITWENATFELVDPNEVLIDQNARTVIDLEAEDPDFVASVRDNGVLLPVIGHRTDDGRRRVKDGQRRTLAARITGKPTIPMLVTELGDEGDWARLVGQWILNEHRAGLSTADKARVLEELALFDMSDEDIAAALSMTTEAVQAGLRIRRSTTATAVAEAYPQLDLLQVAALTEFDDDPAALTALEQTLADEPEQFDHQVSRLRLDRQLQQARAQLAEELTKAGTTVIQHSYAVTQRPLTELLHSAQDTALLGDNPQAHATCPGHAAYLAASSATGQVRAVYVCQDWKCHGHLDRYAATLRPAGRGRRSEREKVAARRVRANNKAWRAAEPVRREWVLRKLLGRRTPPAKVHLFAAAVLIEGDHALRKAMEKRHALACQWLGLDEPRWGNPNPLLTRLRKASANEAVMLTLTVVVAAFEAATSVGTWQRPDSAMARYFTYLRDCGYPLSPVERLVLDPAADAADWPSLRDADSAVSDQPDEAADDVDEEFDELDEDDDLDEFEETGPQAA